MLYTPIYYLLGHRIYYLLTYIVTVTEEGGSVSESVSVLQSSQSMDSDIDHR